MKIRFYIIAILILTVYSSYTQSLNILRTDLEPARQSFITATFSFGIDIVSEGVNNCNAIAFELHFNHAEYIKLSAWRVLELGDNSTSLVLTRENIYTDEGIVTVGVASGEDLSEASKDNPGVIHLEFVATQSAIHSDILTFTFINAFAVVNNSGVGEKLSLSGGPYSFNVHSFVEVWPGDTDNDGYVNINDIAQIGLYHGFGVNTKSLRTFKRQSPSVLWYPQKALAWDSSTVTYVDCDGDGAVTMKDILVVALNYDKIHYTNDIQKDEVHTIINTGLYSEDLNYINPKLLKSKKSISIPLYISSNKQYIAAAIKMNVSNLINNFRILGFEIGDVFDKLESFIIYNIDESSHIAEIATGLFNPTKIAKASGSLINLIVEPLSDDVILPHIFTDEITAIDRTGRIFKLENITNVEYIDDNTKFELQLVNNLLYISSNDITAGDFNLSIYDLFGAQYTSTSCKSGECVNPILDFSALSQGIYFIVIQYKNAMLVKKISWMK